jgi:membrane protein DedA with SNARE-associated domain
MAMILAAAGLAFATLLSEDLACVSAGLLVQRGELSLLTAVTGCAVGIFAGDCGLWALGRGADRLASSWPRIGRLRASALVRTMKQEVVTNAAWSILGSRFLPGARVPLYVAAGALGLPLDRFAKWALLATLVWTPSVILATANLGDVAERTQTARGWGAAAVAVGLLLGMRSIHLATTRSGRCVHVTSTTAESGRAAHVAPPETSAG